MWPSHARAQALDQPLQTLNGAKYGGGLKQIGTHSADDLGIRPPDGGQAADHWGYQDVSEERWMQRARAFALDLDRRDQRHRERRQRMGEASERFTEDEVALMVDAISKRHEKNPLSACQEIENWCSLNRTHRNGCKNNPKLLEDAQTRLFPKPIRSVHDVTRYLADGSVDRVNGPLLNFLAMCGAYKLADAVTKRAYHGLLRQANDFYREYRSDTHRSGPRNRAFENANGINTLFDVVGSMSGEIHNAKLIEEAAPGHLQLTGLYSGNLRSSFGLFFRVYEQLYASTRHMLFHGSTQSRYFLLLPAKGDPWSVDVGSPKFVYARLHAIAKVVGTYTVSIWGLLNGRIAHYAQTWDRQRIEKTYVQELRNFQEAVARAVFPSLLARTGYKIYEYAPDFDPAVTDNEYGRRLLRRVNAIMHLARPTADTKAIFTSDEEEDELPNGPEGD